MTMKVALELKLESGGIADIWRAKDDLDRIVAVKVIQPDLLEFMDIREHAIALAKISHPNVVTVYGVEEVEIPEGGGPQNGIVMELLKGATLSQYIKQGRLSPEALLHYSSEIIRGLVAIHDAGIPHCDLSADNVMVTESGVKILDIYSSPNLLKMGKTSFRDHVQSDICSLKDLLYRLLQASVIPMQHAVQFGECIKTIWDIVDLQDELQKATGKMYLLQGEFGISQSGLSIDEANMSEALNIREKLVSKTIEGDGLFTRKGNQALVLHMFSIPSVRAKVEYDITQMEKRTVNLKPLTAGGWDHEFNSNGFATYAYRERENILSWIQVFRNGTIEAVDTITFGNEDDEESEKSIMALLVERTVLDAAPKYLEVQRKMGVKLPIVLSVSLLGTNGFRVISGHRLHHARARHLNNSFICLPVGIISDYTSTCAEVLKKGFDFLWQAGGYPRSLSYNENGIYQDTPVTPLTRGSVARVCEAKMRMAWS